MLRIMRIVRGPVRVFVFYPLIILLGELLIHWGSLRTEPFFLFLMLWGYLQTTLCSSYRATHGGGGPGMDNPPTRLVTTGPYAYTRNPIHVGHMIFLLGVTLFLKSILGAILTMVSIFYYHSRAKEDEEGLARIFGDSYANYKQTVKRWIPGLF